ncbi:hypothetical protein PBY51_011537 [Eleginops maclovinus]|uniref:Uncharacterized protein n=1 Tax=Eleginops maclovinus TaxID=56733 RepID=A0AAN8AP04_ELEMC|nr:hypothetical protein PBY51_011537 [Eleginops maclovinus]
MTIVFQPVGVTKQGDRSDFLTEEERVKVSGLSSRTRGIICSDGQATKPNKPCHDFRGKLASVRPIGGGGSLVGVCGGPRNEVC